MSKVNYKHDHLLLNLWHRMVRLLEVRQQIYIVIGKYPKLYKICVLAVKPGHIVSVVSCTHMGDRDSPRLPTVKYGRLKQMLLELIPHAVLGNTQ